MRSCHPKLTVVVVAVGGITILAIILSRFPYDVLISDPMVSFNDRARPEAVPRARQPPDNATSPLPDHVFRDFLWHRCELFRIGVPGAKVGPLDRVDSAWWTCKELYEDMQQDTSCLVYGLGSGGDVSFDEHLARMGCEVHSFDIVVTPEDLFADAEAMFTPVNEVDNFRSWRHKQWNWHYHLIGLGPLDDPGSNILALPSIVKALKHETRIIHYFKIDIEGPEYPLMKDIDAMADRIKTFAGEWHPPSFTGSEKHRNVYAHLRSMESKGFRLIRRDFRYDFIAPKVLARGHDLDPIQSDLFFPISVMGELYFININHWKPR